jgi:hypothetical protein
MTSMSELFTERILHALDNRNPEAQDSRGFRQTTGGMPILETGHIPLVALK